MTDTIKLRFDDEEAGGGHSWEEITVPGAIPRNGDWVWHHDGGWTGNRFVVKRIDWTFVQPGSPNANADHWRPIVRVHVAITA